MVIKKGLILCVGGGHMNVSAGTCLALDPLELQ